MKEFKETVLQDLLQDLDLKECSVEDVKTISLNIEHDVKILKKDIFLEKSRDKILISDSIKRSLESIDLFLLISSISDIENASSYLVLKKQHDLAVKFVQDLYNNFNFKLGTDMSIVVLSDLFNDKRFLVEDKSKESFLFKQTIIPLLKRI